MERKKKKTIGPFENKRGRNVAIYGQKKKKSGKNFEVWKICHTFVSDNGVRQ
ncbi:MAG: hypothetical protein K5893_10775 [Prevotella sp.]|nr:hypothetical protein [Prevotella sp.]